MPKVSTLPKYENTQIKALIMEHIHSQRDRRILYRRLVDGITFEKLAEEFNLTPKRIRDICHDSEDELFSHLPG